MTGRGERGGEGVPWPSDPPLSFFPGLGVVYHHGVGGA